MPHMGMAPLTMENNGNINNACLTRVSDLLLCRLVFQPGMKLSIPCGRIQLLLKGSDVRCWGKDPGGTCCMKSIYKSLKPLNMGPQLPSKRIWQLQLPPKKGPSLIDSLSGAAFIDI